MPERERHPAVELDDVVHQRVRLGILAVLRATDAAEFGYLKEVLELTDGNLNRHLEVLTGAGYVTSERTTPPAKSAPNRHPRTVVTITDAGRRAFDAEMAQLHRLAERTVRHHPTEHETDPAT